jgi:hypothetical protein
MCPVWAANAAMTVASVTATGGFESFAVRISRFKRKGKKSRFKEITQRRDEYGYSNEQTGTTEDCAAG